MGKEVITILGSGLIGKSWAMLFVSGGHEVRLFDAMPEVLSQAPKVIHDKLHGLQAKGQLKGTLSADQQFSLITLAPTLAEAVRGATYIQECTPENLDLKLKTYKELEQALAAVGNTKAIIGSSTSTISASKFAAGLSIKDRVLVSHPINPPYFMKLVELVPSPWTRPDVAPWVRQLLSSLGMKPIVMAKELPGFAQNRLQYAILNACWTLVTEGVLSVEDADTVMKEGLAPRYIFMGPLETAHLNAEGFTDYVNRYGQGIYDVSMTMTEVPKMTAERAKEISRQLEVMVPTAKLQERREWRDGNLAELASFKANLGL